MRRWRWIGFGVAIVVVLGLAGYTGYVGYEGSRQAVARTTERIDCRTPMMQFGWNYEAVNYDAADDARIASENTDPEHCTYQGTTAGEEIVTPDGVHIAAWYIPAGNGAGPTAPTVVLVHGFHATKAGILKYAAGLHDAFNLVSFDMRNAGRSTGDQTTDGVKEQMDLRAVLDWLEATKHPARVGVLGNSLGAATALAEARDDPRVEALALDSMHTRIRYQIEARVTHGGYPGYFGTTWAIITGVSIRTGVDIESIDAVDTIKDYGTRPLLLTHGSIDNEDLPERTQAFFDDAVAAGIPAELHWCPNAGHNAPAGMPAEVCSADFAVWTRDFFTKALAA
jgi:pimeloyl-ACP methyl ester carboxylesterase